MSALAHDLDHELDRADPPVALPSPANDAAISLDHIRDPARRALVEWILPTLPRKPFCSRADKINRVRPLQQAIGWEHIQINGPKVKHWIVRDLDDRRAKPLDRLERWQDAGLPAPNFMAYDPEKMSPHVAWALDPMFLFRNDGTPNMKAMNFYSWLCTAFDDALGSDPNYNNLVTKNPANENWRVIHLHSNVYTARDLAGHVDLDIVAKRSFRRAPEETHDDVGRNCTCFNAVRFRAYARKPFHRSLTSFQEDVNEIADEINGLFPEPMSHAEVRAIAKSVARWTWHRYTGSARQNRGIMNLSGSDMTVQERQAAGARYVNDLRSKKVDEAVAKVMDQARGIETDVKTVTAKRKAEAAGVSRRTLYKKGAIERSKSEVMATRKAEIARLRALGYTFAAIATTMDLSVEVVKKTWQAMQKEGPATV